MKTGKNKKWILFAVEGFLILLLLVAALLRKNQTYTLDAGTWQVDGEGTYRTDSIELPYGIYRVQVSYSCDSDMQYFSNIESAEDGDSTQSSKSVLSSGEHLNAGLPQTSYDLWITSPKASVVVDIFAGEGNMIPGEVRLLQTSRDLYRLAFLVFVLSIGLNLCISFFRFRKKSFETGKEAEFREKAGILLGLLGTILLSCIPLFTDHIYGGSDITYHLLRIGNLKDGFLSGQFPVRIDPAWLFGNGYASSVCYGDVFLYFPAFLRLIGFTLQGSLQWFLAVLNIATCLLSYYSFRKIFNSERIGLFCSALYTLSIYRLYKMYSWSALGEVQALTFLPLILYGFWLLYTVDIYSREYKKVWIPLMLGMSGIVECHVLTCEMTVGFMAIACLILWKKTFRGQTILAFLKAIAGVILLNAWFLIPFLDYMLTQDMVIHHVSARTMQDKGLYPAQLFFAFFHRGNSRDLVENGLRNVEAMGVGITLITGLFLFVWLWFFKGKEAECVQEGSIKNTGKSKDTEKVRTARDVKDIWKSEKAGKAKKEEDVWKNKGLGNARSMRRNAELIKAGKLASVLGVLAMAMSLSAFPWTQIQFLNSLTMALVSSIQYPNRFLMIATLFLTFVCGVAILWLSQEKEEAGISQMGKFVTGGLLALLLITSLFYMNQISLEAGSLVLYDEKGMGTGYLSGAEYLPYGTQESLLTYHAPYAGEGVTIKDYEKKHLDISFTAQNVAAEESYADVALLNYKGYQATVVQSGERLPITPGDNNCVRVLLPAGFEGKVSICFVEPWYWRVAEVVSMFSILAGLFLYSQDRLKSKYKQK